jgi:23S rRNA pseudouridine1911/1915/1917 synthase
MIPRFPGDPPLDLSRPLEEFRLKIDARQDGARLDVALGAFLTWRSRTSLRRLIESGHVQVEGRPARPSMRMQRGDVIRVRIPARPALDAPLDPQPDELSILYEDRFLVAVDKIAGLAVHPAGRRVGGTLIHRLHERYRHAGDPARDIVPRLLHRLDRETSGVVAASLDPDFHHLVAKQFEARQVRKTYLAVVHGCPAPAAGIVDLGIGPDRRSPVRLKLEARRDGSGLAAVTQYRVLRQNRGYALVELEPRTGRTHQLRVHLAAIGCPIVGDKIYGGDESAFLAGLQGALPEAARERLVLDRHALHSHRLEFDDPFRGGRIRLEAPLPADMAALLGD